MVKYFNNLTKKLFNESNYGLGMKSYKLIYKNIGLNLFHLKFQNLKLKHIKYIYKNENRFIFGVKLKRKRLEERKLLGEVKCLRALRFNLGLPCKGQRTQTNGRTCKLRQKHKKTVNKKIRFKDDMVAYNLRRRFRHSKRQVRINKPKEEEPVINKRAFGDVYKKPIKKLFIDVKKDQKSRLIRNIWTRNKKAKKIKKHMKMKAFKIKKKGIKRR